MGIGVTDNASAGAGWTADDEGSATTGAVSTVDWSGGESGVDSTIGNSAGVGVGVGGIAEVSPSEEGVSSTRIAAAVEIVL
ncbi:MAG: hypothetical protein AAB833_02370, partial [Patescibacteria group bacterium]